MRYTLLLIAVIAIVAISFPAVMHAASISITVDGQAVGKPVDLEWVPTDDGGVYLIEPYEWRNAESEIKIHGGVLDPDPVISFANSVIDFGAPSSFSFSIVMPLSPVVTNPTTVFDSLTGTVTNGNADAGVTVTALAPPVGIPEDGDGITELQVFTLSDDGGATWQNVGLDAGPTTVVAVPQFNSAPYGTYNQGPIPTIAGGPWTHMRADMNFRLSGGGDVFSFGGNKVLVPEPSTAAMAMLLMTTVLFIRRRAIG
jgi:hypothetical protein